MSDDNDTINNNTINFYSARSEHGYMSNFAQYSLNIDGFHYQTSEHYFQSKKYEGSYWESKVRHAKGPMKAVELGRDRNGPLRRDWESVKNNVMRKAVEIKFRQHRDICDALLATGDAKLVEHTERDSYWGDGGDGSGKNMLGQILMEVRTLLRKERDSIDVPA